MGSLLAMIAAMPATALRSRPLTDPGWRPSGQADRCNVALCSHYRPEQVVSTSLFDLLLGARLHRCGRSVT